MRPSPLLALALFALAACHLKPPSPTALLDRAAEKSQGGVADPRTWALAGFQAYLLGNDPARAQAAFDRALAKDPAEPYALYGQLLLARRNGHPEVALAAALELCTHSPQHPLASSAARYLLDVSGAAVSLDDALLAGGPKALEAGLPADAAQLLRSALATVHGQRSESEAQNATLAQMGLADTFTVLGPFSPYHLLTFDEPLSPERDGSLAGPFSGASGGLTARTLTFPDGRFTLSGAPARGDVYLLAADFDAAADGDYAVRAVTSASVKLYLDGTLLTQRRGFERALPTVVAAGARLEAGAHRLLVKLARGDGSGNLSVGILRLDGQPAQLTWKPASGPMPETAVMEPIPLERVYPRAEDLADALRPEAGEALSVFLAARDGLGRDREGVRTLLDGLGDGFDSAPFLEIRAEASLGDRAIPTRVAHGRATRDLEAAVEKDPGAVNALLLRANLALEENRALEASDFVKQARAAHAPVGYPVELMQARVFLALGVEPEAERAAQAALGLAAGLCEANVLRYDLARKRDAASRADELVETLARCPGSQSRLAEHAKTRGDVAKAIDFYERLLARDPSHVPTATTLVNLYVTQKRFEDAVHLLDGLEQLWPNNPALLTAQADVYEFWGKSKAAQARREAALGMDGSDLTLRRRVERARTGREPLEDYAVSGKKAISLYEARPGDESATSAYVLDFAAVRAFPDGSQLDRIHIIQKALDQSGVQEIAEVNLPAGAQVLTLRTLKPDGTSLEPETIDEKETVSMPGVQVGDYVEQEFLEAHPARGPSEPGFTAASFYFQVARSPNAWSTYTVIAPKGSGMTVDAHNVPPQHFSTQGELEIYQHDEHHVPPFIPEPNSPPSLNELLPFVQVGSGASGNQGVVSGYADASLDRGALDFEVEAFARKATQGARGIDAIRKLYEAVNRKLQGNDAGLGMSAASSVAQDRGSRLWLLKASLEALGYPSRVVAVRTFGVDPASYRFPNEQLLQYVCVRTVLKDGSALWLDPLIRFAPFGELPEQATGGREAYALPEPGHPMERLSTPAGPPELGKRVRLNLKLAADGQLSGTGEETYLGYEAAQLSEALEQLAPEARDQALQRALSRYFGGADLARVTVETKREIGAPLTVRYQFTAPRYAQVDGDKLVLGPLTYPLQLGQRFVQTGSRRTALYIEGTEAVDTQVTLELPKGYRLGAPVAEVKTQGAFGRFVRHEKASGGTLEVDETFRLPMARIPVEKYEDFTQFAGEVDLIQTRDLVLERR